MKIKIPFCKKKTQSADVSDVANKDCVPYKACKYIKFAGSLTLSTIVSVAAIYGLINYAPVPVSAQFLNPYRLKEIIPYVQDKEQKNQIKKAEKSLKKIIKSNPGVLFSNPNDPFIGNPNAQLTIVEFIDYKCGYCRESLRVFHNIMTDAKYKDKIKVVVKQYPVIGGEDSMYAAEVAIAAFAKTPSSFVPLHYLMFSNPNLTKAGVDKALSSVGLKPSQLELGQASPSGKHLIETYKLGQEIGVSGTPTFIIGEKIYGGYLQEEELRAKIDEALSVKK